MSGVTFTGRVDDDELAKLRAALRTADPRAFAVPGRVVRRALRHVREIPAFAVATPHGESCVAAGARVLEVVTRRELGLGDGADVPATVILLALPEVERDYVLADSDTRRLLWRRLFHARVHEALEGGTLSAPRLRGIVHDLGQTVFDEVRAVLKQEHRILPPGDDATVFVEFAATFLALRCFEPRLLRVTFPTIGAPDATAGILRRQIDDAALFEATRLPGASEPVGKSEPPARTFPPLPGVPVRPGRRRRVHLLRRAERAAGRGNQVRAAILARRASAPGRVEQALGDLVDGLTDGLEISDDERPAWPEGLRGLLARGARGLRTLESRVLYDLQKVRVDRERGIFTVDPVEWALSRGRRPMRRPLPAAILTRTVLGLRRALSRLERLELRGRGDRAFRRVLRNALHRAEEAAGRVVRSRLEEALEEVELLPASVPDRVAREKLLEELTEETVERGRLRLGSLRDAVARNQLKLPNEGPGSLLLRDRLLRMDRLLAQTLDGVHRRGEFYLRWLQRLSALVLGTAIGAFLVRFLVIPFAGAFVILEGLQHLVGPLVEMLMGVHPHLAATTPVLISGLFLLLLIHLPPFRHLVVAALRFAGRLLRGLFLSLPSWLLHLPGLARLLGSRPVRFLLHLILRPMLYTVLVALLLRLDGRDLLTRPGIAVAVLLVLSFLVNRRFWRHAEEALQDSLGRNWRYFRSHVVAGLIRLVVAVFRWFLDLLDRTLHTVDEWLRFRGGESRASVVVKGILAPLWFLASYVVRIYVNLLIEPQVNPVKHFPVVTVSHKIILPMSPTLLRLFSAPLAPLGPVAANAIAGSTVFLLPGVFGFLVWELKENWRLFARNRPKHLKPIKVGHHGETVLRLLKPGFHSGTLPKLYRRLRRAEEIEDPIARTRRRKKLHRSLQEVRHAVAVLVEREFLATLLESGRLGAVPSGAGRISTGSNSIRVEIPAPSEAGAPLQVALEEQSGRVVAHVVSQGWLATLEPGERNVYRNALLGLYKLAGVEYVREQVREALGPDRPPYDFMEDDLVVWPGQGFAREVRYDLSKRPHLRARARFGDCPPGLRELPADEVVFRESKVEWSDWLRAWDPEVFPAPRLLTRVPVLGRSSS